MKKIFNSKLNRDVIAIFPGEYYVSSENEVISTLLGSCISVCLYDKVAGIGGMNHFLLPEKLLNSDSTQLDKAHINKSYLKTRYGVSAMEVLILGMQNKGARRENLSAKVFGGGKTIIISENMGIGMQNINFIKSYLKLENITLEVENTGGFFARKVLFNTGDNTVLLEKIDMENVIDEETNYREKLENTRPRNEIIYF